MFRCFNMLQCSGMRIQLIPLIFIVVVTVVQVSFVGGNTASTGTSIGDYSTTTGTTGSMKVSTGSDEPAIGSSTNSSRTESTNHSNWNNHTFDSMPKLRVLQRPPFLKHVTKEQIRNAIQIAEDRHRNAVQRALSTYPVWQNTGSTQSDQHTADVRQELMEFPLQKDSSNCLPDYGDVIPTTVYVTDPAMLTREECATVIQHAERHFQHTNDGRWTRQKSGQYEICGFDLYEIPTVKEWFLRTAEEKLLPLLQRTFRDFCGNDTSSTTDICIDNAYLFKYTPETGRRTDIHTDSGCLSFTIALTSPDTDYDGGGTWFHGLHQAKVHSDDIHDRLHVEDSNVLSMDVGQITIRPGGVKHCGYAVTRGTRYIIGGFCIHRTRPEHVRMLLQSSSTDTSQRQQELLEAATVLNPGCTAAYNILANHHLHNGNPIMAQQILEYCIHHVDPLSSEVAYALASIYMEQQMFEKASQCVSICLQIDPNDVEAIMMSASIASSVGDSTKERYCYQNIIGIPDAKSSVKASAYCNLGVLHQGEALELEYYRQSLICQPRTFSATYSLASALASRKQYKESIELFRQAIVDQDDTGTSNTTNGQSTEMIENRRKALRSLYTATMEFIKEQHDTTPVSTSREDMMEKFYDIMGKKNFVELQQQK